jgi:UDP-4-amino-4,6-dideoxy-N-acetyl-beta-L-altrosamine N-acetyltransferase
MDKYKMKIREYKLVPLIELDLQSKLYIRHIRNEDSVRKWMYTDQIININEHIAWINRLEFDDSKIIFVVLDENKIPLGVVSLNALDYVQKRADWAYYLTSTAKGGARRCH